MRWIGRSLGGCTIEAEIGRSSQAVVYQAYHPEMKEWVAIKVMTTKEPSFLARFKEEAESAKGLQHPNLVQLYDTGIGDGIVYTIMEYVPGNDLVSWLDKHPLDWVDTAKIIIPLVQALAYLHEQGSFHGDIKPSNILLPKLSWPFLTDYKLFRLNTKQNNQKELTTGAWVYVAPEQVADEPLDFRVDMYSLGLVIYRCLTGRLPFIETGSSRIIMLQRLFDLPPKPSLFRADINSDLEEIVMRLLARKPAERYPDMTSLLEALTTIPGSDIPEPKGNRPVGGKPQGTKKLGTAPLLRGPYLLVSGTGVRLPLPDQKEVVLGRSDLGADVQPDIDLGPHGGLEGGVSRFHARLRNTAQGWMIMDLKSTNGTSINNKTVSPGKLAMVENHDVIHCGRLVLEFHEGV